MGQRLAFLGGDGIYVFDGDQPASPPRRVLDGAVSNIAWSPDGFWIACRIQSTEERQRDLASIKVVDVTASEPVATTLIEKSDAGRIVWTASGVICYWERHTGLRRDLMAPPVWSAINSGSFPDQPWIVPYYDQQLRRVVASRLTSVPTVTQNVLTALTSPTYDDIFLYAVRADGVQLLVDVVDSVTGSRSLLTDVNGNTIADLAQLSGLASFVGTSFGSSGYILGHTEEEEEDGHKSTGTLYVVSTQGEPVRRIQNAAAGTTPKMSATGALIAYRTSDTGDIHVGTLQIQ